MVIKKELTGLQAYQKLTDLCARSEHCQQEMLEKMRQWGVSEEEQAEVMQRLVEETTSVSSLLAYFETAEDSL